MRTYSRPGTMDKKANDAKPLPSEHVPTQGLQRNASKTGSTCPRWLFLGMEYGSREMVLMRIFLFCSLCFHIVGVFHNQSASCL